MYCTKCGKKIMPEDAFCTGCGAKIERAGSEQESRTTSNMDAFNAFAENTFNTMKNSVTGTGRNGVDFMIRRYFLGFGDFIWISVLVAIVSGFLFLATDYSRYFSGGAEAIHVIGMIFLIISVIALLVFIGIDICFRLTGIGREKVDQAMQEAIQVLKARAQEKFNVDIEQTKEIEPIIVAGAGNSPTQLQTEGIKKRRFFNAFSRFYSKDPVEAYRIEHDRQPRYLLMQTTMYAFTDTQLLTYSGNMDISTGVIYDEQITETFYKDVNSVTQRDLLKKYKVGLFKKEYFILKYFHLDVCGISKWAAFDSRFAESGITNAANSLNGMESYIREKKF